MIASGLVPGRAERYEAIRDDAGSGRRHEVELSDGRIIEICARLTPARGWVATHEDVTEARRAADRIAYLAGTTR
jgi:hypothetical protein